MNLNFPFGLSEKLIEELSQQVSNSSEITDVDEKIVQILKKSPENLIDFLSFCLKDVSYLQQHENLVEKLLKRVDKFFIKQKFSLEQSKKLLTNIQTSPFALKHGPTLCFHQKDNNISVNRLCAMAQSSFFQTKASSKFEKDKDKVNVDDISPASLHIILNFLNTEELPVLEDALIIQEIMEKAHEWQIESLLKKLPEKCQLTKDNAFAIYQSANFYSQSIIKNKAFEFLTNQEFHFYEIVDLYNVSFGKLPEIVAFCQDYCLDLLNKIGLELESEEKEKEGSSEKHQKALSILKDYHSFSKEHLATLSAGQISVLIKLFPEKIQALNLSVYTEDEIELLVQQLPPSNVEWLNFSGKALSTKTIEALAKFPMLRKIDLSNTVKWNKDNPENFNEVDWGSLALLGHLTHIDITNCPALSFIEQMIKQSPDLEELKMMTVEVKELSCFEKTNLTKLNDQYALLLGQFCPKLKTLEIAFLSSKGLNDLCFNNGINETLTSLALTDCSLVNYSEDCHLAHYPEEFLNSIATNFPNLKCLILNNIEYTEKALEKLSMSLIQLEKFEIISSHYHVDPLLHFAKHCPNLREITTRAEVSDETIEHLIENCPNLVSLRTSIKPYQLDLLIDSQINLEELDLNYRDRKFNKWMNKGLLLNLSSRFPNLKSLKLPPFSEEISDEVFEIAFSNWNQLVELQFYGDTNQKLSNSLKKCHRLESLSILNASKIGCYFLSENISKLSELKKLKHLECSLKCSASDISELIRNLPNLEKINFPFITDDFNQIFEEIVSSNPTLSSLYLATYIQSGIRSDGKYKIDSLLTLIKNTNFKELHLLAPEPRPKEISDMNEVKNILLAKHPHLKSFAIYGTGKLICGPFVRIYEIKREEDRFAESSEFYNYEIKPLPKGDSYF